MEQKKAVETESDDDDAVKPTIEMYLRTALFVISWIVLGISSEIIGPTMNMLAHNTGVTYNGIATALASGSIGGLMTNLLCGFLQKLVNNYQDIMLVTAFLLRAILSSTTPFINSLLILSMIFFSQGIAGSLANMAGTNLLFKMWKKRSAAPLNMVHFGYGCGAIIGNFIVRPFMNKRNSYFNSTNHTQMNSTMSKSNPMLVEWDIRYPYLITASLALLMVIGHLIFVIRGYNSKRQNCDNDKGKYQSVKTISSSKNDDHPEKTTYPQYSPMACGQGYFGYGLSLSILFVTYMFFVVGTDQCFAKFYFSYLKFDRFGISTDGASWGIILFWFSFSMGRLIGAIESVFIRVSICLVLSWCQNLIVAILWLVYVWMIGLTATSLFVLGSLTGLAIGPLFASSFAWINEKLRFTPMLLAASLCGAGLGASLLQKIAGYVMDHNPNYFPILITVCVIISIVFYILSNIVVFIHERNLPPKDPSMGNDRSTTKDKFDEEGQMMIVRADSVIETQ